MDAITLLKQDHRTVEELFKKYESFGPRAKKGRQETVDRIIRELSVHASIEEAILYPTIREAVSRKGELDDLTLEALEEHHVAKWLLSELDGMPPEAERFRAKMMVLIESVRHHVEEEEQTLFPEVRKELKRKRLGEIGDELEAAKKSAPRKPNPRAADTPEGNGATAAAGARVTFG